MAYNNKSALQYNKTAGKITILTILSGVATFLFLFVFNLGQQEFQKAQAQATSTATTTLTVLNTPPVWVAGAEGREEFESSTTSPTNSFSNISWVGTATDANGDPYFMLVCESSATPTPGFAASINDLGTAPPSCSSGTQWGVSTGTVSGTEARVVRNTTESAPFGTTNAWFAWVCDDEPTNARCLNTSSQGTNATNSSPFFVNPRPVFTNFNNNGPTNPGDTITFTSTSSDAYTPLDADIFLLVCSANTYSTTTNTCAPGDEIASTTVSFKSNAQASYILPVPTQDAAYDAFGFLFDQFGHSAVGGAHGTNVVFTVNNVAPTIAPGDIILNDIDDIILTVPGGETTGFQLEVTVSDANSCLNTTAQPEIVDVVVAIFRSGIGTTTCNGTPASYDPNGCYPNSVATSTWNLSCTPRAGTCTHTDLTPDETVIFDCTFPLWYLAEPTVAGSRFPLENWVAAVAGVDDDNATGTLTIGSAGKELVSFVALDLLTTNIVYSDLEPGDTMASLTSSSTIRALGNTGLNQSLGGDSMCIGYTPGNPCITSATSTIPQSEQRYATTSVAYGSGFILQPTSTPAEFDIRIPKATLPLSPEEGTTFWGIAVPASISISGEYTGQNIFIGVVSPAATW